MTPEKLSRLPQITASYLANRKDAVFRNSNLIELTENSKLLKERLGLQQKIVLITGPSGAGKDTLINNLSADKFVRWRTWTTRQEVRPDEVDNDPYVRATRDEFEKEVRENNFIEHNDYSGNLYGTHKREAEAAFSDGRVPVLRVDPRGAMKFNKLFEGSTPPFDTASLHHYFVVPPTLEELVSRLKKRDQDEEKVQKRLEAAISDLPFMLNASYILVSYENEVAQAVSSLVSSL